MSTNKYVLPIVELFSVDSRRALIQFALSDTESETQKNEHSHNHEWYNKTDLEKHTGYSTKSIAPNLGVKGDDVELPGPLVRFNIYEVRDPKGDIVHYRPKTDSDVYKLLKYAPMGTERLIECMSSTARRHLVEFFLDMADPQKDYSMNELQSESAASWDGIRNHIDELVDFGLLETVEGERTTRYRLADNEVVEYLYALNATLVSAHEDTRHTTAES